LGCCCGSGKRPSVYPSGELVWTEGVEEGPANHIPSKNPPKKVRAPRSIKQKTTLRRESLPMLTVIPLVLV